MQMTLQDVKERFVKSSLLDDEKIASEIERCREMRNEALGMEDTFVQNLDLRIGKLLQEQPKIYDKSYPRIDLGFLKSRKKQGMFGWKRVVPTFACFTPNNGVFRVGWREGELGEDSWRSAVIKSQESYVQPKIVRRFYEDMFGRLKPCNYECDYEYHTIFYSISCQFSGAVPSEARSTIRKSLSEFGEDNVVIVSEAPKWELNKIVVAKKDPLIIGCADGIAWLVGSFDPTPVEKAIAAEFTF